MLSKRTVSRHTNKQISMNLYIILNKMLELATGISGISGMFFIITNIIPSGITMSNNNENEYRYIMYVCSTDECTVVNTFFHQITCIQLFGYIIFHFFIICMFPAILNRITESMTLYITGLATRILRVTHNIILNILRLPHYENFGAVEPNYDTDTDTDNSQYQLVEYEEEYENNLEHYETPYQSIFPHHMVGRLPPIRIRPIHNIYRQPNQFGSLVSQHINNMVEPSAPTQSNIISRLINMSIFNPIFRNNDTSNDDIIPSGIPTHIDPSRIRGATKLFAGDSCPICMNKFHLLEINEKPLAVTEPCNHLFCHPCIDNHVNNNTRAQPPCPICREVVVELYISK